MRAMNKLRTETLDYEIWIAVKWRCWRRKINIFGLIQFFIACRTWLFRKFTKVWRTLKYHFLHFNRLWTFQQTHYLCRHFCNNKLLILIQPAFSLLIFLIFKKKFNQKLRILSFWWCWRWLTSSLINRDKSKSKIDP